MNITIVHPIYTLFILHPVFPRRLARFPPSFLIYTRLAVSLYVDRSPPLNKAACDGQRKGQKSDSADSDMPEASRHPSSSSSNSAAPRFT